MIEKAANRHQWIILDRTKDGNLVAFFLSKSSLKADSHMMESQFIPLYMLGL